MSVIRAKKLVPSSGTYLCSMQGYMCSILTLGGKSPLDKKGDKMRRNKNGSEWLDMRQAWDIWLKLKVREAGVRLKKVGKAHDNAIKT